ncbi:MAG: hypothetical protein KF777_13600 [Planctomycetaceae bacterium]|nr:hypothetical protein [Planctomycetaceae bacterium]
MSGSGNSSKTSPRPPLDGLPVSGGVEGWWHAWGRNQRWRDNLHRKVTHKALDIVDDDMAVTVTKSGIGTLGVIGIALAAGVPGAGVGLMALQMLSNLPQAAPQPPPAPVSPPPAAVAPAAAPDVERAFRILFFDKDRNPIEVKPFTPAD